MNNQTQGSRIVASVGAASPKDRGTARLLAEVGLFTLALVVAAESAIWFKHSGVKAPELAVVSTEVLQPENVMPAPAPRPEVVNVVEQIVEAAPEQVLYPVGTKFFDGRPLRVAKTITMVVTAYSPDEASCGDSADGITASTKSVYTNGGKMVAADTRVLPMHSMITVPGYGGGDVVPVLDRGGAIKGKRLDVLFPTDAAAREWGVRKVAVTVWEFADEAKGAK